MFARVYILLLLVILFINMDRDQFSMAEEYEDIHFIRQPHDLSVTEGETAFMPCVLRGTKVAPFWYIRFSNGSIVPTSSSQLPHLHFYNGTGLLIKKVEHQLNKTEYSCRLHILKKEGSNILSLKSKVGVITVKPSNFVSPLQLLNGEYSLNNY